MNVSQRSLVLNFFLSVSLGEDLSNIGKTGLRIIFLIIGKEHTSKR